MKTTDYTVSVAVNATASKAFDCINNVSGWWTENIKGNSQKLNDEFTVQFGDVHLSTQKLIEVIPASKLVWLVTQSRLNFIKDKDEWTGTKIVFEIEETDGKSELRFTHQGLVSGIECYDACTNAWSQYIQQSLKNLINTGVGQPTAKENNTQAAEI